MIVFVAPYSPYSSPHPHLGAARKIENIVAVLSRIDDNVIFVNTAHNDVVCRAQSIASIRIGEVEVTCITPRTYGRRAYGKFRNLFDVSSIVSEILLRGHPWLVWCYNGYALESLIGSRLSRAVGARYIIEFEDWIFSRSRGFNPKPLVDYICWRLARNRCDYSFCVSKALLERVKGYGLKGEELPGFISPLISSIPLPRVDKDFFRNDQILVGYFGSLNIEKGVGTLLDAIEMGDASSKVMFIVCGSGPELSRAQAIAVERDDVVVYTGLNDQELASLMRDCHILVNPHLVSDSYLSGLFPSKVIEYIGSGRVVISTQLPALSRPDILSEVVYFDFGASSLKVAVDRAIQALPQLSLRTEGPATLARQLYGPDALRLSLCRLLESWGLRI